VAQILANKLQTVIANSSVLLYAVDSDQSQIKPRPDKWSLREILGHLVDSCFHNHRRAISFLNQEHLVFDGYNQDLQVELHHYQKRDFNSIVDLWILVNMHFAELLHSIPEESLKKENSVHNFDRIAFKTVPQEQPASMFYFLADYIAHIEHHVSQIIPEYQRIISSYSNQDLV